MQTGEPALVRDADAGGVQGWHPLLHGPLLYGGESEVLIGSPLATLDSPSCWPLWWYPSFHFADRLRGCHRVHVRVGLASLGASGGEDACGNEAWCRCLRRLRGGPSSTAE